MADIATRQYDPDADRAVPAAAMTRWSGLGCGIGLRAPHLPLVAERRPAVDWFEIHAENFLGGGPARRHLMTIRADWPVALHAVGLSLGSAAGVDHDHLGRVARLAAELDPPFISDHLSWSGLPGLYLNDLLPLPYTEEALAVVAANVDRVQERLGRPILLENPSAYFRIAASVLTEAEFLGALCRRCGCGILLDVNNLVVNEINHGEAPMDLIAGLDPAHVAEIHLAGHARNDADGITVAIDDHGSSVPEVVWALYDASLRRFPAAVALVEWDSNIPALEVLVAQAAKADARRLAHAA